MKDFLLEVITIEIDLDKTLAWIKDIRKPYNMKISNFLSQIWCSKNLLNFVPRVHTLEEVDNGHGRTKKI